MLGDSSQNSVRSPSISTLKRKKTASPSEERLAVLLSAHLRSTATVSLLRSVTRGLQPPRIILQSIHSVGAGNLPYITHVAIKYNGKVYSLPKPNRHHHVIRMIGGMSIWSAMAGARSKP